MTINLYKTTGSFAENKDIAKQIRVGEIVPALERGERVTLDFMQVESTTQSFVHALISELMRDYGSEILDRIQFRNCNETVRKIIEIVADYMQQTD